MKQILLCVISLLFLNQQLVFAENNTALLKAENALVKSTIPGVKVSLGYIKLTNMSDHTIHLIGAKSDSSMHTEFHKMEMSNSQMSMRKVDEIMIKAHQSFAFKKGTFHLMFMGLKKRFVAGESVVVDFLLDNGTSYQVTLPIMDMHSH